MKEREVIKLGFKHIEVSNEVAKNLSTKQSPGKKSKPPLCEREGTLFNRDWQNPC